MKHFFHWNVDNFKFNILSKGQVGSRSINNFMLTILKMLPRYEYILVILFLHLVLERWAEIVLKVQHHPTYLKHTV